MKEYVKLNQIRPSKNQIAWLVKSGDRVLGPYSGEAVEQLLLSREIVVIDEIKRSYGRWKYIRDEAFFAVVVEKLRVANQNKIEDTDFMGTSTSTLTMTLTEEMTQDLSQKTAELENSNRENSRSSFIQDAEFADMSDVNSATEDGTPAIKQFGLTANAQVQKNIKRSSSAIWVFALIFICMALTIAYRIHSKSLGPSQGPDFAKTFDLALQAYRQGSFADSLRYFKEATQLKPNDPDVIINMAPLMLSIEGQKVEVKRTLGEVLAITHSEDQIKQAQNILGLVAIADEDYGEAGTLFTEALKIDPKYIPALFNLGVVDILRKDYASAEKEFSKVLVEDPRHAPAYFLLVKAKMLNETPAKKVEFKDEHELLSNFAAQFYDLRQEASLLDAILYSREDNKAQLQQQIHSALEADPFVSEEFIRDPLLSLNLLSWIYFTPYCEEMSKKLSKSAEMKVLNAICLVKTGRAQEASKLIEDGLAQSPYDSLLLSIKAYALLSSGRVEEAHATLELAQKSTPSVLSKILMGRICMKNKNDACIRENFESFKAVENSDLFPAIALVGLGEITVRAHDFVSAKAYRDQLKVNAQNYIPFLKLESEIDGH